MEEEKPYQSKRSLEINPSEKYLMGVCSAFANFININPVFIRIIVLVAFYFLGQSIILIYSAFGILLPVNNEQEYHPKINSNKVTTNILFIAVIVLLILLNNNLISIKEIFSLISEKIDAFSFLVFSIALLINNHYKTELNMSEIKPNELCKSEHKIIYGICGGFAEYLNLNPNLVRLIWIIFFVASFGLAAVVYFALNFVIPSKKISGSFDE
jgi:phage shock protein C